MAFTSTSYLPLSRRDPDRDKSSGTVTVSILGPPEVWGASRPFTRAWTLDLVVYLSLHPRGVPNEIWANALWPERQMAAPTLYSIASSARRALGRDGDGVDHLPRAHGRLRLGPGVTTDVAQLEWLAATTDLDSWHRAISLIRGRPFEGLRDGDWSIFEGFVAHIEELVVNVVERLATHHLALGDGRAVARVARRALLVSPYDERLYRILMRAADVEGHPRAVESVMEELLGVLGGPAHRRFANSQALADELVHPETAELFRSLACHSYPASRRTVARL
jgi:DNA-binding SARP family transcriptional activator